MKRATLGQQIQSAINERPFGPSGYRNIVERSGSYLCLEDAKLLPSDTYIAGFCEKYLVQGLKQNDWDRVLARAAQAVKGKMICKAEYQRSLFPSAKLSSAPCNQPPTPEKRPCRASETGP